MRPRDLYPSLVQMIIHAERITWNRLHSFLIFNTVLILAWATVYAAAQHPQSYRVVLIAICILGGAGGIFWAALGYRGRALLDEFTRMGTAIEADAAQWGSEVGDHKPVTAAATLHDSLWHPWSSSRHLLTGGPIAFTVFYLVLLIVS